MKHTLILLAIAMLLFSCERVNVNTTCTVVSHTGVYTSSNSKIEYSTEVICDDGKARAFKGIAYYVMKEGTKIPYSYGYYKFK